MPTRREKLEALLAEEPQDHFLRYSLALELAKEGNFERSRELLASLIAEHPPYVPACFMAARQAAQQGRADDARTALRIGIDEARRQGDHHAADEMNEWLNRLGSGSG